MVASTPSGELVRLSNLQPQTTPIVIKTYYDYFLLLLLFFLQKQILAEVAFTVEILCMQLEMILQADEYEQQQPGLELQEFFDSTRGRFKTDLGRSWAEEIVRRRNTRLQ